MAENGTGGDSSKSDKVNTGHFDGGLCEGMNQTDAQKPSPGKNSEGTLKDSSTREKEVEEIFDSPAAQSCIAKCRHGSSNEGVTGEKRNDGTLDESETSVSISFGENTVQKLEPESRLAIDSKFPKAQMDDPDQRFIKKYSERHTDGTDEKDKGQTSKEEVNKSQSFEPLEETERTHEIGSSVAGLREMDGLETNQKLAGNKDGDSDKIFGGNAGQISGAENVGEKTENMPEHAHSLGSGQKLENSLYNRTEKTLNVGGRVENNGDHTTINEKGSRCRKRTRELKKADMSSFNGGKGKGMPEEIFSQEASHQTNEKKSYQQLDAKKFGGEINREVILTNKNTSGEKLSEVYSDQAEKSIAISKNTEHKNSIPGPQKSPTDLSDGPNIDRTDKTCQEDTAKDDVAGNVITKVQEGTSTAPESTDDIFQQDAYDTLEHHAEISEVSLDQTCEKKDNHKSVHNTEREGEEGFSNENSGKSDNGDNGSENSLALENQSMQGRERSSQGMSGQEGSDRNQENVNKMSTCTSSATASEIMTGETFENKRDQRCRRRTDELKKADMSSVSGGQGKGIPEEKLSQEASHETNEIKTEQQLGEKKSGGEINRVITVKTEKTCEDERSETHQVPKEKSIATSKNNEHVDSTPGHGKSPTELKDGPNIDKTDEPCREQTPKVDVTGTLKMAAQEGTSIQTVAEPTDETFQQETNGIPEGHGGISEASLDQTRGKNNNHKSVPNTEKREGEGVFSNKNRKKSNSGSESTLALEQSVQGGESTSQGRSEQEGSDMNQKNANNMRNTHELKLLIKYLKKQEKKDEDDVLKYLVPCSLDFQLMWNFYTQTDYGRKMLDVIAAEHHCNIFADSLWKGFFIFLVLDTNIQEESAVKNFVHHVLEKIFLSAKESLSIDSVGIDSNIQEDVQIKIKERKELTLAWIELVGDDNPVTVYTVCHKDYQQLVMQIITEVKTDAIKSFKSHRESVAANFKLQMVMTRFEYLKEMGPKFPNTVIKRDEKESAFLLQGPRDEVRAAVGHLEELLNTADNEVHEEIFSPGCQFEIFGCSEICDYIDKSLPKLPVVWTPNHLTKKIHLFSRDREQLKGIDKSIKGCIKERLYPLSKDHSKLLAEEIQLLKELKQTHNRKIVIHLSEPHRGLLVTTADDIFEVVDAAMQKIISREIDEVHHEASAPEKPDGKDGQPGCKQQFNATNPDMEMKDLLSENVSDPIKKVPKTLEVKDKNLFRKLLMEHIEKFNQIANEHCVSIEVSETQSRVGFILRGSEKEVQHVSEIISSKIKEQQMQLQQDISGMACATEKIHKQITPSSNAVGKSEGNEMSAKAEEPGLKQREWSYPNGKKITLLKATTCDADVIIIPGDSDQDSQSQSGDKKLVRLKVPDGTKGKAKTDLHKTIEQVLDKVLEKTVGICIKTMEGWNFHRYLKCFLYEIYKCFMRKEGKPCPFEHVFLLVDEELDYTDALEIIQKSFKLEQDKSEIAASQKLLLQEQDSIFKRIRVKIKKGQLHEAQTEVLVITVDRNLDLTKGIISSSILEKAGNGIQKELQQYKGNIVFGQVFKTAAGTLPKPCKAIFHGVLYVYEEHSDCLEVFQRFLAGCLEDANKKKYKSIAFPPIGTGKLRYPKDVVASLMFQSVVKFEQAHPTSKLEEVVFVIYEKDQETLKVFEEFLRRCFETTVADELTAMPAVIGVSKVLKYGQVQVQAKLGTFENENQNCLLVLWEKPCLYNISDKNHILYSAGSTVTQKWREHRNTGQFQQDVVLVTPGGKVRYTEIIHVASDINNIKNAAKVGLMKADSEKMKTVVVPITKDDSLSRDVKKFCMGILQAVNELGTKLKFVKSVTLVIQGQTNFPFFNEVFEQESRMYGTEKKTDASFGNGAEMHATEQLGASLSSSETVIPTAITESMKDPSTAGAGQGHSQKHSVGKEPAPLDITEADRSDGKDIVPPKALLPGNEQHKNILQYSDEEKCCFFVCDVDQDGVKSLRRKITASSVTAKFVYPDELGNALVICTNPEEKDTLMNKVKINYKVQCVGPQKIQGFTAVVDPVICRKARKMTKMEDLVAKVEQQSGVTISYAGSSIQFKAVTSHQLKIAQECLIRFAEETLEIKVQKRSAENSISGEIENTEQIKNVSQSDFLALQSLEIYSKWTQKFNIKFTHEKETLFVQGDLLYLNEEMKKNINDEIAALKGKQKVEITYDPQEKEQFRLAIDEAKSDQLLLVWDDDNKQVLVYSDSFGDIQKFKHKVELKMGKKKATARRGNRFANQENTMPLLSEEEPPVEKKITRSFSWSQDATNVEVFKTLEGIVVKVYEANILKLDVDCIVNAANENLQHGGGVALVIAKGAGPEIDREGSEILKIRGQIKVGEQCVTTAGNLPYDCIIHTVGPRWSDYYPHNARDTTRCETDLFSSIIGCFFEAENHHLRSIALPAISSGIFAVPRDMCTEQYAKAVIHYSKTRTSQALQEIHFIDKLPDIVKDMQLAFKRHLGGDGDARHIVKGGNQTTAINDHAGRDSGSNEYDSIPKTSFETFREDDGETKRKQNPTSPVCPEIEHKIIKKQKFCVYKPSKNLEVNIHTTDITKMVGVEAIVCSDDRRGSGHGAVASALLKMGKSKYESAKKKAFEKEVHFGDVIATEGVDSNFHLVIHAVAPSFKDKISLQEHKEIVKKCYDTILDDINNWQKASLALPLIGTGCAELGYEGSAKLFLDSLEVFCNRSMTLNIKVIHIVDKNEHITEKVADVFIKHTETVRKHLLATHGSMAKPPQYLSSHTSSVGSQGEISQVKPKSAVSGALSKENCSICLKEVEFPKTLNCGHTFCLKCIEIKFEIKPVCPKCGAFHGKIYGNQPDGGKMTVSVLNFSLNGFEKNDTLKVEYWIPGGRQGPNHPEPGKWFDNIRKTAYLPDTREGRKVCELLKVAFERRLIFKLSRSSWGYVLVWSDIHHKTALSGGQYGYPDSGYLKRVQEQLAAKGVTEADLKPETAI